MAEPRVSQTRLEVVQAAKVEPNLDVQLKDSQRLLRSKSVELEMRDFDLALANRQLSNTIVRLDEANSALSKRTVELENANAQLQSALQLKANFLAAISHDLKNPIIASTRILEMLSIGRLTCEPRSPIFDQLLESNRNVLRMIWNLLDLYRGDLGAPAPIIELVQVEPIIRAAISEHTFAISQKQVSVQALIENDLAFPTDTIMFRRIFVNLLDNAIRFSPEKESIVVTICRQGTILRLEVSDHGPGMSPNDLANLFERFSQPIPSRHHTNGTGLGLYACKLLVSLLGGSIWCESTIGLGTKFFVELPVVISSVNSSSC